MRYIRFFDGVQFNGSNEQEVKDLIDEFLTDDPTEVDVSSKRKGNLLVVRVNVSGQWETHLLNVGDFLYYDHDQFNVVHISKGEFESYFHSCSKALYDQIKFGE